MALCFINSSPRAFTYCGTHTHDYHEVILNLEGEGDIMIGSEVYPFSAGSVHIVPKNVQHIKSSPKKFRDIYFHTDTLPISADPSLPIAFHDDGEKTFEKLMKMMLYRYMQGNKNDSVLQAMYELAMKIIEDSSLKGRRDPVVEALIHKLTHSFNDPEFSLSAALESTGYSKDHIRRRFSEATGMTPSEYLTDIRVTHAKKFLQKQKELKLSISDVGTMCGYYDTHYFARVFKQRTGMTPSQYAKDR